MKRRSFLQAFTAIIGLGTVAREALALQPGSRPESEPAQPGSTAQTKSPHDFRGAMHVHESRAEVSVESYRTLAPSDAWAHKSGYRSDGVMWTMDEPMPTRWRPVTLHIGGETIEIETTPDATAAEMEMEMAIYDAIAGRKARG